MCLSLSKQHIKKGIYWLMDLISSVIERENPSDICEGRARFVAYFSLSLHFIAFS